MIQKFHNWEKDQKAFTEDMEKALDDPILLGLSKDGFIRKAVKPKPIMEDFDPLNVFHVYEACWQLKNELKNRKRAILDPYTYYPIIHIDVLLYHYINIRFNDKIDNTAKSITDGERILGIHMANIKIIKQSQRSYILINIDDYPITAVNRSLKVLRDKFGF